MVRRSQGPIPKKYMPGVIVVVIGLLLAKKLVEITRLCPILFITRNFGPVRKLKRHVAHFIDTCFVNAGNSFIHPESLCRKKSKYLL